MFLPRDVWGQGALSWRLAEAGMEDCGDGDEAAEEDDLNKEAANDDVFSNVHVFDTPAGHYPTTCGISNQPKNTTNVKVRMTRTCPLHDERKYIPRHKDLGQPPLPDER